MGGGGFRPNFGQIFGRNQIARGDKLKDAEMQKCFFRGPTYERKKVGVNSVVLLKGNCYGGGEGANTKGPEPAQGQRRSLFI